MIRATTTVIDASIAPNERGLATIVRQPRQPFRRERLENPTPDQLARAVHEIQQNVHEMTQATRTMPEAGMRTYLKDVAFSSGVPKVLVHMISVAQPQSVTQGFVAASQPFASNPSQIRFEIVNQRLVAGACYRSAVDARTITLVPNATFFADVRLFVVP